LPKLFDVCKFDVKAFAIVFKPTTTVDSPHVLEDHRQCSMLMISSAWDYEKRTRLQFAFEAIVLLHIFFDECFNLSHVPVKFLNNSAAGLPSELPDERSAQLAEDDDDDDTMKSTIEDSDVSVALDLVKKILLSIRDFIEIAGPYVTDDYLAEAVDAAEAIIKRTPQLTFDVMRVVAPSHWTMPEGITDADILLFRRNKISHRNLWKAGASLSSKPGFLSLVDEKSNYGVLPNEMITKFIDSLEQNLDLKEKMKKDLFAVNQVILKLPNIRDSFDAGDLRQEYLIERLVSHVHSSMTVAIFGSAKHLGESCTRTTTWLMQFCREMIENKWGFSIDERDDIGNEAHDRAASSVQLLLNQSGVTALCLDLISEGIQEELKAEAMKLIIALLFKEGGHNPIQATIDLHLRSHDSSQFFLEVKMMLMKLIEWHQTNPEGEEGKGLPEDILVVRCLQLMCEGHFKPLQNLLRQQVFKSSNHVEFQ
jgi:hypothetical protein